MMLNSLICISRRFSLFGRTGIPSKIRDSSLKLSHYLCFFSPPTSSDLLQPILRLQRSLLILSRSLNSRRRIFSAQTLAYFSRFSITDSDNRSSLVNLYFQNGRHFLQTIETLLDRIWDYGLHEGVYLGCGSNYIICEGHVSALQRRSIFLRSRNDHFQLHYFGGYHYSVDFREDTQMN